MMTDISIIIPYYNRRDLLPRTLESVASQSLLPDEIILVDNSSTDGSQQVAEQFCQRMRDSSCIVQLVSCPTPGAAAARNTGLGKATGKYVYFFDSDDEMSPDFVQEAARQIRNESVDMVVFKTQIILPDGRAYHRNHGFSTHPYHQILSPFLSTQTMLLRKDFLLQCGAWDGNLFYWNDWELGVRLLQHLPKVRFVKDRYFHKIYAHGDSITGDSLSARIPQIKEALGKVDEDIRPDSPDARLSRKALYFRKTIIAAQIRRDGDINGSNAVMSIPVPSETSSLTRFEGALLSAYIRMGGKGAWAIARYLLLWA